jgi:hypothetical protein
MYETTPTVAHFGPMLALVGPGLHLSPCDDGDSGLAGLELLEANQDFGGR